MTKTLKRQVQEIIGLGCNAGGFPGQSLWCEPCTTKVDAIMALFHEAREATLEAASFKNVYHDFDADKGIDRVSFSTYKNGCDDAHIKLTRAWEEFEGK